MSKIELSKKILSDITVYMKYAKYIPELNRRETWEELVTRNKEMHQKMYPDLHDQIEENYKLVYNKKVKSSFGNTLQRKPVRYLQHIEGPIQ